MASERITTRIYDLDDSDRPREKALNIGVNNLTNSELLAILLGSGMPGKSVLDLSHEILRDADNKLSCLCRLTINELTSKYDGVGPAKAISLMAAIEFGSRCVHSLQSDDTEPVVKSSRTVYDYMCQRLERLPHEEFWVVFLNRSNRIMAAERVNQGGVASTLVDVKLLMKKAIDKLACNLIFVHNHPSGNLKPSGPDDSLTKKLKEAAQILDIKVLDHIIISPAGYYSYNDEGRL